MTQTGKIHPDAGDVKLAPPPPGSYYKVDEQHLPVPATSRRARRGRRRCCCLLTWMCSLVFLFVLLFGIVVLVTWLVFQPKAPKVDVEKVGITGLTALSLTISTNISYEIMVGNPNKRIGIYYDDTNVHVELNGMTIGEGIIPAFYQGYKNTTYLKGEISSQNLTLNAGTLSLLTSNPTNVPLYATVDVKVRIKVCSIKSPKIQVKVRCDLNVDLTITSGSQLKYKHCKVKW